ncbi:MAG: hypothetical protein HY047_13700 [Acidobacteria bacterium]|nr:hypothetical protein [Acidobacteriota bacterium]
MVKRVVAVALVLAIVLALVPSMRLAVLRSVGGVLLVSDPVDSADVGVMTESGEADEIEVSELYQRRVFPRVLVLAPSPTAVDLELTKRGVHLDDPTLTKLRQLGVPAAAITTLDAGEGGTSDSASALADWVRGHPSRVLVVISPTHARRYRRTLLRLWPEGVPPPHVTWSHHALFRSEDWWRSRRTLRDGLFELQKLAWDCLTHPW